MPSSEESIYQITMHASTPTTVSFTLLSCAVQGMLEAAIDDYTLAIQLNPHHCRAYYNRAFCHDRLNHVAQAIQDYTRALQLEPHNATAFHNRGSLHERLGRCVCVCVCVRARQTSALWNHSLSLWVCFYVTFYKLHVVYFGSWTHTSTMDGIKMSQHVACKLRHAC